MMALLLSARHFRKGLAAIGTDSFFITDRLVFRGGVRLRRAGRSLSRAYGESWNDDLFPSWWFFGRLLHLLAFEKIEESHVPI